MNKFKVGQRVKIKATGKQGKILDVDQDDDINCYGSTNLNYYVSFKNNDSLYHCFFTVHDLEEVKDILNKKEKRYLSNVIKPFKSSVTSIAKRYVNHCGSKGQYIEIKVKNIRYTFAKDLFYLPEFKQNTMYKNMEINKEYTLEELGL